MLAKSLLLSALAASASAQAYNATYVQGLAGFLTSNGYTRLAEAVTASIDSPGTQRLLANVNGTSKTLLVPINTAFNGLDANATSNTTLLGERLSYHLLSGDFPPESFATLPSHTIARTYLNDSSLVQLEGNKAQALVFGKQPGGRIQVLNQNTNVTLTNATTYESLRILTVDAVIDVPGTAAAALDTYGLTGLATVLNTLGLIPAVGSARGITIFAPNDAAFAQVASVLPTLNQTQVAAVIGNHVINGTTVYSTLLGTGSYTSAAGSPFTFTSNSSGTFVTSGSATAQVIQSDVLIENGVVHVIDRVLANPEANPSAASSAYAGYTSSAAQGGPQTGNVGGGGGGGGAAGQPTETGAIGSQSGAGRVDFGVNPLQFVAVFAGLLAGAALVI